MLWKKIIVALLLCIPTFAYSQNIVLIGNPRSLTTVFTRYMINRGDFKVFCEPVVNHKYSLHDPVVTEIKYPENYDADMILNQIFTTNRNSQIFVKEFAGTFHHSDYLTELAKRKDTYVIFIVRDPAQSVISYYKLFNTAGVDLGFNTPEKIMDYTKIRDVFYRIKNKTDATPILIDAKDLANNSPRVIAKLCELVGIPYDESHLRWEENTKLWDEDSDTWMKEVAHSTGFKSVNSKHSVNNNEFSAAEIEFLAALIERNKPIYEELIKYKI